MKIHSEFDLAAARRSFAANDTVGVSVAAVLVASGSVA